MEETVEGPNRDLNFVNILLEKADSKKKHKNSLERKFNIRRKKTQHCKERMKQLIKAVGAKIKRSHSRIKQSQQNRMFVNNQGLFFH